jgi:hypothetical protein
MGFDGPGSVTAAAGAANGQGTPVPPSGAGGGRGGQGQGLRPYNGNGFRNANGPVDFERFASFLQAWSWANE